MSNYLSVGSSAESSADISVWHIAGLPAALMLLLFLRPCFHFDRQTQNAWLVQDGPPPLAHRHTHALIHLSSPLSCCTGSPSPTVWLQHGVPCVSDSPEAPPTSDCSSLTLNLSPSLSLPPSLPPSLLLPSLQIYNRTSFSKHNPVFFLVWLSSIMEHPELCASCFSLKPIPTPADITDRHTNHYSVGLKERNRPLWCTAGLKTCTHMG